MIYVPADIRRLVRLQAAEDGRPVSDLYVEAIRTYLSACGRSPPEASTAHSVSTGGMGSVTATLIRHEKYLAHIVRRLEAPQAQQPAADLRPTAEEMAKGMAALLSALAAAGAEGLKPNDLLKASVSEKVGPDVYIAALDALKLKGLIVLARKRWVLGSAAVPRVTTACPAG